MKGVVSKIFKRYYTVASGDERITCQARGRIHQDADLKRFTEAVAVGDEVIIEKNEDGTGSIREVLKRKNVFTRLENRRGREDLLASNLDQLVVIQAFRQPRLNLRFVDRLLVRGEKEGILVLLCVNKLDLADGELLAMLDFYYKGSGLVVVLTSAETGRGSMN